MRCWYFLCLLLLISTQVAKAEDSLIVDSALYPSYALVQDTDLPPLDYPDLAQRFLHVDYHPASDSITPERSIGDIETFYISSTSAGRVLEVSFELRAIGEHVYIWVERNVTSSALSLENLVTRFDTEVYEFVRALWGSEASPGIDGETRIHIVITQQLRPDLNAYFSARNATPAAIAPFSNERDMLVLSARVLLPQFQDEIISTAAHEFQHLIRTNLDFNETGWMNEGFSTLTEHLLGLGRPNLQLSSFASLPQTQLNALGIGDNRQAEYGAARLFMIYLYDRFGLDFMQTLSADPDSGLIAVDNTLDSIGGGQADLIFADWVIANFLQQNNTVYGYRTLSNLPALSLAEQANFDYPFSTTAHLSQYGSHYFQFGNLPDDLIVALTMPDTVGLIPTSDSSGQFMWYSLRGDNSNPRLTRAFDLRDVDSAQLDYRIWYDLEADWDYAYLSVSADGGATWQLLSTPEMSSSNPNGRAYGSGYNGQSGGWLDQRVSLDPFVGQEILLRFEMVTDDGINRAGVALDDVRLDALGYHSDFEADVGGWQAEGWIRSDNRLPQRAWLQVIQHQGTEFTVTRYLAQGNGSWTIDIAPQTQFVTLVISPFAPMTTEGVVYTLSVR